MKNITKVKVTTVIFSLGLLTSVSLTLPTAEAKKVTLAEVQRACERALEKNTASALESFLKTYPPNRLWKGVACYALAQAPAADDINDEHPGTSGSKTSPDFSN